MVYQFKATRPVFLAAGRRKCVCYDFMDNYVISVEQTCQVHQTAQYIGRKTLWFVPLGGILKGFTQNPRTLSLAFHRRLQVEPQQEFKNNSQCKVAFFDNILMNQWRFRASSFTIHSYSLPYLKIYYLLDKIDEFLYLACHSGTLDRLATSQQQVLIYCMDFFTVSQFFTRPCGFTLGSLFSSSIPKTYQQITLDMLNCSYM